MKIFSRKLDRKVGYAPGDINYFGEEVRSETFVKCIYYNLTEIDETTPKSVNEIVEVSNDKNTWIDIKKITSKVLALTLYRMITYTSVLKSNCKQGIRFQP